MKFNTQSKLGSILFSTFCVVAFGFLASPVIGPVAHGSGAIQVRQPTPADTADSTLRVSAGKSMIIESSSRIIRASVANPDLVRPVYIDDHELLLNGKNPGRTDVTLWQEGGTRRQFNLYVEHEQEGSDVKPEKHEPALTGAYQDAMARVQTAITGAKR